MLVYLGRFDQVLPTFAAKQFDLVFVDGAHDTASVAHDAAQALRLVRRGGRVAFHDWGRFGVAEGVRSVTNRYVSVTDHLGVIER